MFQIDVSPECILRISTVIGQEKEETFMSVCA